MCTRKYLISLLQLNMVCGVFFPRGAKVVVILIVQIKMRRRLWSLIEFLLLSSTRMFPTRELVFVSTQPQCPHLKYAYEKHVYFTNSGILFIKYMHTNLLNLKISMYIPHHYVMRNVMRFYYIRKYHRIAIYSVVYLIVCCSVHSTSSPQIYMSSTP